MAPEPLSSTYLASDVLVELDGEWADAPSAVDALGEPIWVLTAHNPGDTRPGAAANDEANAELRAAIESRGVDWLPAVGRAPDGSHSEASFALVGVDSALVAGLAARFDQVAFFVLERSSLSVVATDGTWRRVRPHRRGA
jgi:hypothetical protein